VSDETRGDFLREVLDRKQAADFLGISVDQFDRVRNAGGPPCFHLGNCKRWLRSTLLEWAKEREGGHPAEVAAKRRGSKSDGRDKNVSADTGRNA
jgi:predicted DNA-binding transcriptional regulator AlpA